MMKRGIKIVILFIIVIVVFISGWHMFKRLEYNRQSFAENIYNYVSPYAIEVININREYNLEELLAYDESLHELTDVLGNKKPVPIVISKYQDGSILLMTKVNLEQETNILKHISSHIALPYSIKTMIYKDGEIQVYCLPDNGFLACTSYKSIFAVSKSYRLICKVIDSGNENTFFSERKGEDDELILRMLERIPVSIYVKSEKNIVALDYNIRNDTIKMEGYLFVKEQTDSLTLMHNFNPYKIDIPNNVCIDNYQIYTDNHPATIKITLNKIY